jgi:ABC-2 type transport system permease protein
VVRKLTRLIKAELFKLRKRTMTSILLYVMVGILVILYLVLLAVSKVNLPAGAGGGHPSGDSIQNLLGLPVALPFALAMLATFGTVLACILMASSMGNEYNWRTIRTMLISSESRTKLLAAKLISVTVYVLIGMIIGLAAGFVMSLITTAIGGYKFDFSFATGTYWWDQFVQFWRTFYIMLPYILLAFMFSVVGRSAMPGIAVGVGVFFLEPIISGLMGLAGGWVAQIPDYLIRNNFSVIDSLNNLPGGIGGAFSGGAAQTLSLTHAAITLGIYIIVFLVIAFYMFRRRDVTS